MCLQFTLRHQPSETKSLKTNSFFHWYTVCSLIVNGRMDSKMPANVSGNEVGVEASSAEQQNLVHRCLGGDSSAWEAMVTAHEPRIRSLVFRYSHLRSEVEDLKQEVFLRIFCSLKTFRADSGNLGSWITRIGKNLIVDHLRRTRPPWSKRDAQEELEVLNLEDRRVPSPEGSAIRNETNKEVRKSLKSLSPDLEVALALRYLQEMSYQEIAETLQIPGGTVKSRIKRGREKLTKMLGPSCPYSPAV